MTLKISPLLLAVLLGAAARADVRCPEIFGDHMVLQRDRPVAVWGDANPGETVRVAFAGQHATTAADAGGHWRLTLAAMPANAEARTLSVSGVNQLVFTDVLVGEVWFCSGQSNMEKPLGPRHGQKPTDHYEAELAASNCPPLRLFQGLHAGKPTPADVTLRWRPCNADALSSMGFSAAAYFFGRELQRELGVPVGLIHSSFGGTRIEAWMPRAAFDLDPQLRGLEKITYDHWVPGVQPTELYQSRVAPYVPFTLRGFLWYQGENNVMNAEGALYAAKFRALIASWRTAWTEPAAPFYYVLLAPFAYSRQHHWARQLTPEALPALWAAQTSVADVPHTGFVVTTDLAGSGKDIHPTNKRDVGRRLARLALADTYGRRDLVAHSPQFRSLHRRWLSRKVELTFKDAAGLRSRDGQPLTDFAVAGKDRIFHPAQAIIRSGKVVVSSPLVARPAAVRFAWDELAMPNLVNGAGLPAVPFRTDDWPLVLEIPKEAAR